MSKIKVFVLTLLLFLFLPYNNIYCSDNINYPSPTQNKYVNDYANILDNSAEQKIISIGHELYSKTKAEIVVVTMDKLPESVDMETYANGLFREWGIGDKKLNNGILFIVNMDPEDRSVRIEVGYGLEGRVPDAIANRILQDYVIPFFQKNDYNTGVLYGYYELCSTVASEYNITLSGNTIKTAPQPTNQRSSNMPFIIAALLLFCFDGFFLRFRILRFLLYLMASSRYRGGGGGFGGGGSGGGFGGFGGGSSGGGGSTKRW